MIAERCSLGWGVTKFTSTDTGIWLEFTSGGSAIREQIQEQRTRTGMSVDKFPIRVKEYENEKLKTEVPDASVFVEKCWHSALWTLHHQKQLY